MFRAGMEAKSCRFLRSFAGTRLAEIHAFVRERFTDVVLSENGWIVLRPGS